MSTDKARNRLSVLQSHLSNDGLGDSSLWHVIAVPTSASDPSKPKDAKDTKEASTKFVIENKQTGQKWDLQTNAIAAQEDGSHFVILQTRPSSQSLTVLDNRTGKTYDIPVDHNSIAAASFEKIKHLSGEGLVVFDPAYQNTAVAKSAICFIDGDAGILHYRGYPIEELAEKSNFLEVSYLLIYGDLPNKDEYASWQTQIMRHTYLHNNLSQLMKSFNYDAHPMGMFISVMAGMSTFHPEANPSLTDSDLYVKDAKTKNIQIYRILGKAATVAACAYRHRIGREYNHPQRDMSYTENFLFMLDRLSEQNYKPNPTLVRALEILFILHADHELNCSTAAMRHISSSHVDPYSSIAGAAAALYGPLHGGACEAVLRMLEEIGKVENVPAFIEGVKKRERKLMGFGHRVYKNYDPRARIIKKTAYEVFSVCGREPLIDIAIALEQAALSDKFFIDRKLFPNVDFYSGLIYKAMGFPTDFFPVLFTIPRVAGWLAHWNESLQDKNQRIWRPRQIYVGEAKRSYIPMDYRNNKAPSNIERYISPSAKRSGVASFTNKPSVAEAK